MTGRVSLGDMSAETYHVIIIVCLFSQNKGSENTWQLYTHTVSKVNKKKIKPHWIFFFIEYN